MLKFVIISMLLSLQVFAQVPQLSLHDVSILLPLPQLNEWQLLPSGSTRGALGELLPLKMMSELPQLIALAPNQNVYEALHAVGIRLDPCFIEGAGPVQCQPQIRFIWQILAENDEATSTFDAGLHTFYSVSKEDLQKLTSEIKKLKAEYSLSDAFDPLDIHPLIKQQGLSGDYYQRLMTLIYSYIGEGNLTRITFMTLFMSGNTWEFGGFDIHNGEFTSITIPRINSTAQKFVNTAVPEPSWFRGGAAPAPTDTDNFNVLLKDSNKLSLQNEEEIINSAKAAFKFENPNLHNPGTVDCVSCHVAQPVLNFALAKFPSLGLEQLSRGFIYSSAQNIANQSPRKSQTNILRAFGYFENSPVLSQRTVNESAEVLNYFNLNYK